MTGTAYPASAQITFAPPPSSRIGCRIFGASSYVKQFYPSHILDESQDQSSRWTSPVGAQASGINNQWVILELDTLSIVRTITFGKFTKPHPCNVKEFKIYGGVDLDHMTELAHSGLRNDPIPETIALVHRNQDGVVIIFRFKVPRMAYQVGSHRIQCFPCRYIKIVPLSAHGQTYNMSIWFVCLWGIQDQAIVQDILREFTDYVETASMRLILKHLRQRGQISFYNALLTQTGFQTFEHPLITSLYNNLVLAGDFAESEKVFTMAASAGLLQHHILSMPPKPVWTRIRDTNPDGDIPTRRGGHQMCIDSDRGVIYLLGGWDAKRSLADFWSYSIASSSWTTISRNTSEEGGPGARDCHKIVFDRATGYIYVLGGFRNGVTGGTSSSSAAGADTATAHRSDFYRYATRGPHEGKWELISSDTKVEGGPPLVFDLQMAIDSDYQALYVFGGRVVSANQDLCQYSGMYRYDIRNRRWALLFTDPEPVSSRIPPPHIPSRSGHSMILDPRTRQIYIFSGDRGQATLSDMYTFSLQTHEITQITSDYAQSGGPGPGFTQRATMDEELGEIYLLSGLTKDRQSAAGAIRSSLWIMRLDKFRWIRVPEPSEIKDKERQSAGDADAMDADQELEPQPRFAHQVVYDTSRRKLFLFGGNSGDANEERLDDFWSLTFTRPDLDEIMRRAKLYLRRQRFLEMCNDAEPMDALAYLQATLSAVVDHTDEEETASFRSLLSHLFSRSPAIPPVSIPFNGHDTEPAIRQTLTPDSGCHAPAEEPYAPGSVPPTPRFNIVPPDVGLTPPPAPRLRHATPLPVSPSERPPSLPPLPMVPVPGYTSRLSDGVFGSTGLGIDRERFKQRTELFENLLMFMSPDAKQPDVNLLNLVHVYSSVEGF
ncbi:hypothetical protein BOTBODRAFT_182978 [Botryobasidium botryosum FD-172 SS1]|uniref:Muskelin N-terminal domain-containing protein n=1 Tax=Botryobasidium botryosum (strain FD-172 SS1) TaxID=930990 RepID=A0A067N408_BOTB1|nr:hypothetical protein BOTBODRAFT_182978 [Botryobasidium botryosum FD-172 SS1]